MPEIQALIFDCDGTLTNSMPIHYRSWRATMLKHGIDFAEDRFYALGGVPSQKIIEMLAAEKQIELDAAAVADQKEQAFLDLLHELEPLAHILDIARQNRGQLKMAVASGGWNAVVRKQLTMIGCLDWFDAIVTAEDTEKHKPEPDVFLEAARRLDVPAARCIVYEDSDLGIEAARRAGMQWVDVRPMHNEYLRTRAS